MKINIKEQSMCGKCLKKKIRRIRRKLMYCCYVMFFKKFIKPRLEYYCLDPSHSFSSPGLSWEAMLKMTRIKLEKINDINVY